MLLQDCETINQSTSKQIVNQLITISAILTYTAMSCIPCLRQKNKPVSERHALLSNLKWHHYDIILPLSFPNTPDLLH